MTDFTTWFQNGNASVVHAGHAPHSWQADLASGLQCTNRLIRIPTGMGKTLGVLLAWTHHRINRADKTWPTRLVWCLPMRTLVEQTHAEANRIISQAGLASEVDAYMLMGGVEQSDWHVCPERPAILIGTQDMLLSRALNRGLLDRHGPTTLAFLESILRAADVRVSRLKTNDPALSAELKVVT